MAASSRNWTMQDWIAMRILGGALACLAGLLVLLTSSLPWSIAHAMSVRDILYLNKYGEGVTNVSWCSDQAFTFLTHGPSRERSLSRPEYSRFTTVNMFSIETQQVRLVIVSDNAAFGADCVRGGEYVFLNGVLDTAMATDAQRPAQALFSQFIDVRLRTGVQQVTPVLQGEALGFSQEEDQSQYEQAAVDSPNVCSRFLHATSWPLVPVNTICARLVQDGADGISLSPEGGFVSIRSKSNPLIVGREYRNDGTGPVWLNHGGQP